MKKSLLILLAFSLLFCLAACGNSTADTPSAAPTPSPSQSAPDTESTTEPAGTGNVLVVYYSASNHTEAVAQTIADHMNADIFELTPTRPYSEADLNWTDEGSRVNAEHNDEALRDIELESVTPDNWDGYDTVFVGYPIWWGIAAWPVNNFVKGNDFTGKTVIPFCTSASSGLGESGELLAEMAGTGDWQDGQRFSSSVDDADVTAWLDNLGL